MNKLYLDRHFYLKRIIILHFFILVSFHFFAQINSLDPLSSCLNPKKENSKFESMDNVVWKEKTDKRTLFSSTYYGSNREYKAIYSKRAINYYDKLNQLVPIDSKLRSAPLQKFWHAPNQPFPTYFFPENASFALTLKNGDSLLYVGGESRINNSALSDDLNGIKKTQNGFLLKNIITGVDKEFFFLEDAVKYNYYVKQPIQTNSNEVVFSENISLPKGFSLIKDKRNGKEVNGSWIGDLLVVDRDGKAQAKLQMPVCIDANSKVYYAGYRLDKQKGTIRLQIVVPSTWLNNALREFPIIIDPLVVGPSYQWTGGDMPSCIMQNYNIDSILVTRPASVTLTGFHVSANFYANFFSGAVKSDGKMFFSTECANSQSFTITGPLANTAGTAYLDSFTLTNPLTCCIPESCSDTSFYVRMHLGRNATGNNTGLPLGIGCNTTYIKYSAVSLWPFKVVVSGRTVESYGNQWVVPQAPKCSNDCSLTGYGYVRYGVAPYTFSHPWSTQVVTIGQNNGCASGATNFNFDMIIPNCPLYCDPNYTNLSIPPPQIVDACGTSVAGILPDTISIITAPQISVVADTLTCSEQPYEMELISCVPNTSITHWGNGVNGTDTIFDTVINNSNNPINISYQASGISNGCYSDTSSFSMIIQPLPNADFIYDDPIITGVSVVFTDQSSDPASIIQNWIWELDDSLVSIYDSWQNDFNVPGTNTMCLKVTNEYGCQDSICKAFEVYPAIVKVPNVITSNNDGVNDFLEFQYLEFYPDNELTIWNRWGNIIYTKSNYANDWNGENHQDGTYFFILKNFDKEENYSGFFQLIK